MATKAKSKAARKKRTYTQAPAAIDVGIPCPHCKHRYDHRIINTWPNGNRRRKCGGLSKDKGCGLPFTTLRKFEKGTA